MSTSETNKHDLTRNKACQLLSKELGKRSEFLEICLRTDALPARAGQRWRPMSEVRGLEHWEYAILDALDAFEGKLRPPPPETSASDGHPFSDYLAIDRRRQARQGHVESQGGPYLAGPARTAARAEDLVDRFVRQQLMYLLLILCQRHVKQADERGAPVGNAVIHACLDEWHEKIPDEILTFYDAALLQLLAGRNLVGDIGVLMYDTSVWKKRQHLYGKSKRKGRKDRAAKAVPREHPDHDGLDDKVPARKLLEGLLGAAFYSTTDRPSPYWYLVQRPETIIAAVEDVLKNGGDDLVRWCVGLCDEIQPTRTAGEAPQDETGSHPSPQPTGRSDWFYDPGRIRRFLHAAQHALRAADEVGSPSEADAEDQRSADDLEQALELFSEACLDALERKRTSAGQAYVMTMPQYFRIRTEIERVWWRSFRFLEEDSAKQEEAPARLARWCNRSLREGWGVFPVKSARTRDGGSSGSPDQPWPVVIVYGAGIAGLAAAHELAERNFKVYVVNPDPGVGGMARTQMDIPRATAPREAVSKRVPGEHGYRLFPSFYRHVFDTMKRTPVEGPTLGYRHRPTAFDQLEPTFRQVFASRRSFVPLSRARPRSLEDFRTEYMRLTQGLGFSRRDLARFFFKLVRYLMTCSARRAKEYEGMSLFKFFGADQEGFYSEPFIQAIRAAPQALVAMDAESCDARTQGNVYLQLLLDQVLGGQYTDSTLSGPTSVTWLEPWRTHLKENLDVEFHQGELLGITGTEDALEVLVRTPRGAQLPPAEYHVIALDVVAAERVTRWWDSGGMRGAPHDGVPRELRGFTSYVDIQLPGGLERYEIAVSYTSPLSPQRADDKLRGLLRRVQAAEDDGSLEQREQSVFRSVTYSTGQVVPEPEGVPELRLHLWFDRKVGPAEVRILEGVLRRWAGSAEDVRLTSEDPKKFPQPTRVRTPRQPEQRYGDAPGDRLQTFTGIQYYFAQDFKLVRGHVYFPDTEWGLSAVSQSQFWVGEHFKGLEHTVRGVLSVDIGDCRRRSSFTGKSLMESSPDEIQKEVWRQIKDSLRTTRGPAAPVTNLPLPEPLYWHLDSNLVFAGGALRANRTPFLINNVGDWENRPRCMPWVPGRDKLGDGVRTDGTGLWQAPHGGYRVHEGSVVFCGTYMRTFTRMSTMEAANESARHAVNAILDHMATTRGSHCLERSGITGDYCEIWDIEEHELPDLAFLKRVDEMLFRAGKPHIADILQLDKLADVAHPEPSPAQALLAALGATVQKDWGMDAHDLAGSMSGLMEVVRGAGNLAGSLGGAEPDLKKLWSWLGAGKADAGKRGP